MPSQRNTRIPLKIGLSPRFLHSVPREMGFKGKTLQYMEQSIAHWLMSAGALWLTALLFTALLWRVVRNFR